MCTISEQVLYKYSSVTGTDVHLLHMGMKS